MNYSERIRERLSDNYTITIKSTNGDDFSLGSPTFESFCIMIVKLTMEDSTPISNESPKDLGKWTRTMTCTNGGVINEGLNKDLENSGYKRFYEGLLQSASKVSIETYKL